MVVFFDHHIDKIIALIIIVLVMMTIMMIEIFLNWQIQELGGENRKVSEGYFQLWRRIPSPASLFFQDQHRHLF